MPSLSLVPMAGHKGSLPARKSIWSCLATSHSNTTPLVSLFWDTLTRSECCYQGEKEHMAYNKQNCNQERNFTWPCPDAQGYKQGYEEFLLFFAPSRPRQALGKAVTVFSSNPWSATSPRGILEMRTSFHHSPDSCWGFGQLKRSMLSLWGRQHAVISLGQNRSELMHTNARCLVHGLVLKCFEDM